MFYNKAFLIVEKGEPLEKGCSIKLTSNEILLGRLWDTNKPDISFSSLYISKKHAVIGFVNNQFTIVDLGSKHGTQINDSAVEQNKPYILGNGDRISLAREEAVLIFNNLNEPELGETVDFTRSNISRAKLPQDSLAINLDRREILINGKPIYLSGKDIELLLFLYQNRNKATSYNEIKSKIWPERLFDAGTNIPDVGIDEITALVYRLRKRLGMQGQRIKTIPRFGYMLDL
jgi:pSer/pThr/pTyr-binding forkhead associated (FHA) protein